MKKFSLCLMVSIALMATACSSIPRTAQHRKGLFERLAEADGGRRSRGYGNPSRDSSADGAVGNGAGSPEVTEADLSRVADKTHAWRWPLKRVEINSAFGERGDDFHEGIDLKAASGTPVYAASGGRVLYANSKISGYGRMIVLAHDDGLHSVYAHLSRYKVKQGQRVNQGELIGLSGATGRVSGPHLHFEVREGSLAFDPARFVRNDYRPASTRTQVASTTEVFKKTGRKAGRDVARDGGRRAGRNVARSSGRKTAGGGGGGLSSGRSLARQQNSK